jgi:hypothetical protein
MKTYKTITTVLLGLFTATAGYAQEQTSLRKEINKDLIQKKETMKTYLIEREIADAGKLTPEQLRGISQKSNEVVAEIGPRIIWLHSYVADNKVYCIYKAENENLIKRHAEKGGFPANKISKLSARIDPGTAKD